MLFQTCMSLRLLLNTKYCLKNVGNQLMEPIDFHSILFSYYGSQGVQ